MKRRHSPELKEPTFSAPTDALELIIVEYCLDILKLQFGEFWYKWFPSHSHKENNNHSMHIECDVQWLRDTLVKTFPQVSFVNKVFKIQEIPLPEYCEHRVQYYIHFKMK